MIEAVIFECIASYSSYAVMVKCFVGGVYTVVMLYSCDRASGKPRPSILQLCTSSCNYSPDVSYVL